MSDNSEFDFEAAETDFSPAAYLEKLDILTQLALGRSVVLVDRSETLIAQAEALLTDVKQR